MCCAVFFCSLASVAQSVLLFQIRHRLGFFSYFVGLLFFVGWEYWVHVIEAEEVVVIFAVMVVNP